MARPIDDIADAIAKAISAALADRQAELTAIAQAGGAEAGGGILGDVGQLTDFLSTALEIGLLLDPPAEVAFQAVKAAESSGGKMGEAFGIGYMLGQIGFQLAQPAILPLAHKVNTVFQTEIPDPATAATQVTQGIITQQDGRNIAHGGNTGDGDFDNLVDSASVRPDTSTLLELLNRGEIADADAVKALQRHGIDPFWHAPILALRRQLLSPADLALAQLRGVIDQTTMQGYADQLGVTSADMGVLVENTGEPPGVEQLLEAYRRGFIDQGQLEHGIRQSRVRDEWISTIEQLRYAPMATADAVRAVVEGHITDDEGKAISQQNGLLPEHWQTLVDAWGRPPSHEQMLTLYHRGQATIDEVKQAILESDVKNKYVDQLIDLGRTLIPERQLVAMVDHAVITRDQAMVALKERGYNDADADAMIRLGVSQRTTSHKTLTRADILTMYTDALMNRQQASDHLKGLGYSDADIGDMLDLADYKRKAQSLKVLERGVQATLRAGHITTAQAVAEIEQAGLDHNQAQTMVDEWVQERRTATRTLTEAQVIKAVSDLVITPDDGRVRMKGLGLSDGDIDVLWKMNGFMPFQNAWTPAPPPPAPAP